MSHTDMSPFAKSIYLAKYALRDEKGELVETEWVQTAKRVVVTVLETLDYTADSPEVQRLLKLVEEKKFIPGGRYLYATGKDFHMTNNCLLLRAEDSREGWADLLRKSAMSLQTGAGIGIDYSAIRAKGSRIKRTGGVASGPVELMKMINEVGRGIMQGGNRRSAIWAGLKWSHPDVFEFIHMKDWPEHLKEAKAKDFNAYAPMDMTNISVLLDDEFFAAYHDEAHEKHALARKVMSVVTRQMFTTGEPGLSINLGDNWNETLRNAPVAADTRVLTADGYKRVGDIVNVPVEVWTGKQWAKTTFKKTGDMVPTVRVRFAATSITCDPTHEFLVGNSFDKRMPASELKPGNKLLVSPPEGYSPSPAYVIDVVPDKHQDVFCCDVGVEEHSFMAEGVIISNCTEVTSEDDSDICNLGSINLACIESVEEMMEVVSLGTLFLLAGTVYSDLPYSKVFDVRTKNRRLGLGLMGLHEWLLMRGFKYAPNEQLAEYLYVYAQSTRLAAFWADQHKLNHPIKTRAIAPTGTIAIVAETTTGIEPIFCAAYKRRYLSDGRVWNYQYVIDPTAKRLVEKGVDPDKIEDAYSLSLDIERRLAFQAWLQGFVDQSISSTINMPEWGSPANNEEMLPIYESILIKYLPKLRGITVYPDGARGGQPLVPVAYTEAAGKEGVVFEETEERCVGGVCGS